MRLFCYYFVTRIRWSNKTNSYICIVFYAMGWGTEVPRFVNCMKRN